MTLFVMQIIVTIRHHVTDTRKRLSMARDMVLKHKQKLCNGDSKSSINSTGNSMGAYHK